MTRTFPALCLASTLALGGSLAAQQASPNQPSRNDGVTTPADYEQTGSKTTQALTLTGCLDRASNGTYELRNARMSMPAAARPGATGTTGTAGTTGTSGTAPSATAGTPSTGAATAPMSDVATTWTLKSSTDLAPHVGHQVQVTGRPGAAAGSGNANSATTSNPATTATGARMESAAQNAHSVEVDAVRMISQSCS